MEPAASAVHRGPWTKGKIVGQKAPFKLKDIWALRIRLQMEGRVRELALFKLGIDSKLRGCDLVALKVRDICHGGQVASNAIVMQHETQRPVHEGHIDPSAHEEPSGRPATTPPLEAESTVRYLGIEVDDALENSEQTEI